MVNPQAFKELQEARKNKIDPNEYLNKITGKFNQEQKQEWDTLMRGINRNG